MALPTEPFNSSFQPPSGWIMPMPYIDGAHPGYPEPQHWRDVVQGPATGETAGDYLARMAKSAYSPRHDTTNVMYSYQTPRMSGPLVTTEASDGMRKLMNWYHHYIGQRTGHAPAGGLTLKDIMGGISPAGLDAAYAAHDGNGNPLLPMDLLMLLEKNGYKPTAPTTTPPATKPPGHTAGGPGDIGPTPITSKPLFPDRGAPPPPPAPVLSVGAQAPGAQGPMLTGSDQSSWSGLNGQGPPWQRLGY